MAFETIFRHTLKANLEDKISVPLRWFKNWASTQQVKKEK